MKKILLVLLGCLLLTGCKQDKFYLEDKYYESNNLIEPTVEEVNKLFENKESFAAFVYTPFRANPIWTQDAKSGLNGQPGCDRIRARPWL